MRIKPPKDIDYSFVECNSFLKLPIKMKGCLLILYRQVLISDSKVIQRLNVQMRIVCDTPVIEHIHDRVIC